MTHWRERLALSAKHAARRMGLEVARYNATNVFSVQRARLVLAHEVDLALDIGANEGQWASGLRRAGYRGTIVSFEPLTAARRILERVAAGDRGWSCRSEAASDETGQAKLHVAANSVSSSLLAMERRHADAAPGSEIIDSERVRTVRLDDIELGGDRIMLKLDIQGAERRALSGAERLLRRVVLVEVELSFEPLYVGGALWHEVVDHLRDRKFEVVAISPSWVDDQTGRLIQADAIFARGEPQTGARPAGRSLDNHGARRSA
jgi:FkbM family methyltransferase